MVYPLLTDRLSIEPLAMRDSAAFVTYRQDPEIAHFQGWDASSFSQEAAEELIGAQPATQLPEPGKWMQLAIHSRVDGVLLGDLALHRLEAGAEGTAGPSFEIGFTLARSHQGRGFAREAASRLLEHLFTDGVGARSVDAATDRRNVSSVKLLTSLGFQQDQQPGRTTTELFKGEMVTVDYFQLITRNQSIYHRP